MDTIRKYTLLLALLVAALASAQDKLTVTMDSAWMLMGRVTPYHIELMTPSGARGALYLPKDSMCAGVEIAAVGRADTQSVDGRRIVRQTIMLQSFDSGVYLLNPVAYVSGHDTLRSERLGLKVVPVPVDTLTTIHDYADVVDVNRRLVDFLPDWMADYGIWILGVIIACGMIWFIYRRFLRKVPGAVRKAVKVIPPYDEAVAALNALHEQKLCEQGREKDFYTQLTDILRNYLQRRFGINAMEMTSTQILQQLESLPDTQLSKPHMDQVLRMADFVKFAKVRPMPDDNVAAYNSAMQFVEDTKPAAAEEAPATEEPQAPEAGPGAGADKPSGSTE